MFTVFRKKRTMDTIAQELLAMNTQISSFATKLPSQYEFLFRHFYRFDREDDDLKSFIDFLYKEMDYAHNQFSQREILEIYISFTRPTLQYNKSYDLYYENNKISSAQKKARKESPILNLPWHWEKVNFAQILLENCAREDFLRLLTSYNRHLRVFLYPEKAERKVNIVDRMITKDSELYKLCVNYFTINAGFELGFNIACIEHTFFKEDYLGLKPNLDRDIDGFVSKLF